MLYGFLKKVEFNSILEYLKFMKPENDTQLMLRLINYNAKKVARTIIYQLLASQRLMLTELVEHSQSASHLIPLDLVEN